MNSTSLIPIELQCILIVLGCLLLTGPGFAQSKTLEALRKSDQASRGIFLYPSTLRMVNIADLESYNELVRDVQSAYFFPLREDRFAEHDFLKVRAALEDDEGFEEYLTIEGAKDDRLFILGKPAEGETVLLSNRKGKYYMGMIFGRINIIKLLDLQREIKDPKVLADNPFLEQLRKMLEGKEDRRPEVEETVDSIQHNQTKKT